MTRLTNYVRELRFDIDARDETIVDLQQEVEILRGLLSAERDRAAEEERHLMRQARAELEEARFRAMQGGAW